MKGIWRWLVPFNLFVLVLSVPMVAGAVLYSGPWDPTSPVLGQLDPLKANGQPSLSLPDGREILDAYHGTDALGNHYFQMNLAGRTVANSSTSTNSFANHYDIHIDLTPDGNRSNSDYRFTLSTTLVNPPGSVDPNYLTWEVGYSRTGANSLPHLLPANLTWSTDADGLGNVSQLEWKYAGTIGTGAPFEWWGELRSGSTNDYTNTALTPIPGAAWLLGSGLIGLIGLKRRKRKTA